MDRSANAAGAIIAAMHVPVLTDLVAVSIVAVVVVGLLTWVRVPTILGLILAGTLIGPHGLGLVRDRHSLDTLAEVGIALLLFTVGLEFSLARLKRIARMVVLGGSLQVALTALSVAAVTRVAGETWPRALFLGFVLAISSTAIVLKALTDRAETDAPHGRFIIGVLIFQDLAVVFMMLLIPTLAGISRNAGDWSSVGVALLHSAAIVMATILLARVAIPRFFRFVAARRSRELFLLSVTAVLAVTCWVATQAGLSVSVGAFLAGLMLADTEFRHRALGEMIPFRDLLTSLFFLSLGMMANGRAVVEAPAATAGIAAFLLFGKGAIAAIAAIAMRFPARVAWLAGAGLAQFSEFGFVLLGVGASMGLVSPEERGILIVAGVLSMMVTPLVLQAAPHLTAGHALLAPLERLIGARPMHEAGAVATPLSAHVVVVGYGVAGRVLAQALQSARIPFIVLELNAETVRRASAAGEPVFYADASSPEALRHAQLKRARALVILINDPDAVRRIVAAAKDCAAEVPIFVRTRYLADRPELLSLGATEVVVEEVEAGVEVLERVLQRLGVEPGEVLAQMQRARDATSVQPERQGGTM